MNYGSGLFGEINKLRYRKGLRVLKWDDVVAEAARNHSKFMANMGKLVPSKYEQGMGSDGSPRELRENSKEVNNG